MAISYPGQERVIGENGSGRAVDSQRQRLVFLPVIRASLQTERQWVVLFVRCGDSGDEGADDLCVQQRQSSYHMHRRWSVRRTLSCKRNFLLLKFRYIRNEEFFLLKISLVIVCRLILKISRDIFLVIDIRHVFLKYL